MSKLIKQTLFSIFILLTLGLFITCDDPNLNPFTNNQGEKVVVEQPTIYDISPVSGSFLNGVVTFTATAKAYIKVEKVEVYIYEDKENGQREIPWTSVGIQLSGDVKVKKVTYIFDSTKYNSGNDGPIKMKFRVFDTTKNAVESIQLVYIIKNNPSDIKMAYPSDTDIFTMTYSPDDDITGKTELPRVQYQGEIRGAITDQRGLRPGFPQIKLWPHGEYKKDGKVFNYPKGTEPDDDDPDWGWATLFLSCDNMQKEGKDTSAGPGEYADRSQRRVINYSSFGLRMAEYTIKVDPDNPDLRCVQYRVGKVTDTDDGNKYINQHVPFNSGAVFNFRIRTRDVEPDLDNGAFPSADPVKPWPNQTPPSPPDPLWKPWTPWIEGHYPPVDFRTPNEKRKEYRGFPVKIRIQSPGVPPIVEINNDDVEAEDLKKTPNKYITDYTSYKIEQTGFRLRLFVTFEEGGELVIGGADGTRLEWKESTGRGVITNPDGTVKGTHLDWDTTTGVVQNYVDKQGRTGTLFTFTVPPGSTVFTDSNGYYTLTFKVQVQGEPEPRDYPFTLYIDGKEPDVKIRYIHGANPRSGTAADTFTVNGNIQTVVDGTDTRGIMTFMQDADMGEAPYDDMSKPLDRNNVDSGRPMIKWIVENAEPGDPKDGPPETGGTIAALLKEYRVHPTYENLVFFKEIQDTKTSSLTLLPSGWIKRELPKKPGQIEANEAPHFKLNTTLLPDKKYYWLYVIAMDQVQNLGYVARKIYVDQDADNPVSVIRPLSDENAKGTTIADEKDLDVTVTISTNSDGTSTRTIGGNWSGTGQDVTKGKRNNILGRNDYIGLNFTDDDGISLEKGGVIIKLYDLNTPKAPNSPYEFSSAADDKLAQLKEILNSGDDRALSGTLSQEIMAKALYGSASEGSLKDGMYKIEITVKDDIDQKVALTLPQYPGNNPGDNPPKVAPDPPVTRTYYFAVSSDLPDITITYPDDNALGSDKPIDIYGTVKSRLNVQNLYITFTPNVINPSTNSSGPILLTLYADAAYTKPRADVEPDADGFYTYYWIQRNVVFDPQVPGGGTLPGDVRNYTVEAYDRLGNLGKVDRTVNIDKSGLILDLIEFNYNRPAEADELSVYGKVSFTISASGPNGLYNVNGSAGVKWWVLPKGAAAPSWGTAPTVYTKTDPNFTLSPATWTGGGEFLLNQVRSGGTYTGVIDTRYLADKTTEYIFYYMVMGKAGNTEIKHVIPLPDGDMESFRIDQSKDYPVIYENTLNPLPNSVLLTSNLIISGTVSDADLFNPAKGSTYVAIRYPGSTTPAGAPVWTDNWINIPVPATYSSLLGGIDPSGAIVYKFDPSTNAGAKTYFSGDGIKYYQIRVTDEPDGPATAGAKWYGKNPDLFMADSRNPPAEPPQGNPLYPGYVYQKHNSVSKIFPLDDKKTAADPEAYIFYVDNTKPEIFFNLYDPAEGHENYITPRNPTFSKVEQLIAALNNDPISQKDGKPTKGNYVKEYKLIDLIMTWSPGNDTFMKTILSNPADPATAGEYPWDLNGLTAAERTKLETIFNSAPQGLQLIQFEATDMVPLTGRQTWTFNKDTQGPDIIFSNINRAIKRATIPDPGIATPAFPSDWPPNVTVWKSAWDAFTWNSVSWKVITTNWPSEYAFKAAADVITALNKENELSKTPSTVIGDENTPAVIQGSFTDEFSSIIKVVPADAKTYFYYRFKDKNGTVLKLPSELSPPVSLATGITSENFPPGFTDPISKPWFQKEVKKGKTDKEADWEIILNPANGFTGTDGENWLDIRVEDSAGNISEIYNVSFLLDTAPPLLGSYRVVPPGITEELVPGEFTISKLNGTPQSPPKLLPEDERVISAAGGATTGNVFSVTGRVNDYNLSNLKITLGQDGYSAYTVTASADIDLLKSYATPPNTGSGVTYTDDKLANDVPDTGVRRLTLAGPYVAGTTTPYTSASTGTPEWEWTFDILAKDALGLRNAAGINADSTRRFIRVTASDKAGEREGPVEWSFYLDTKKPVIEYTNLDKGSYGSSFESDVKLSILVQDDTKIKDVKYIIGRWDYSWVADPGNPLVPTHGWRWYNTANSKWELTAPPAVTLWPSVFTDDTTPARQTTMDFNINNAMLNAAGTTKFPKDLFEEEGKYRIDLCVTDFSLGNGNPHNTTNVNDPDFKDAGTYTVAVEGHAAGSANIYNESTGEGNRSARVFYIDKKDPTLRWASDIEDKLYFRNEDAPNKGQVIFGFIAGDGNTLKSWTAEVKEGATVISISDGTIWENGTTPPAKTAIPEPKTVASTVTTPPTNPNIPISTKSIYEQYFEIKPFMTTTGDSTGTALDLGKNPLPTYTITITVTDGAERTSSITKTFTLDNTPPEFTKFSPPSFKSDDNTTWDAVSGKFNIRGNTTDNSNQLRRVAFYVAPAGKAGTPPGYETSYNFKNPTAIPDAPPAAGDEEFWHWHDPASPNRYKIAVGDTTYLEIEDGTFAWNIKVPQTSLFLSDASAQKYVQWTKTYGGKTINNEDYTTVHKYRDVTINPATLVATTTDENVPALTFQDLNNPFSSDPKRIYSKEDVGLITVYVLAEDAAGNVKYDIVKYWIWPEGDRPIVTAINSPDSTKIEAERLLNGTIRLSGMAKDNERVKNVWFRVFPAKDGKPAGVPYTLEVPVWKETDSEGNNEAANLLGNPIGGNWDERTGKQTAESGANIGSRRSDDPIDKIGNDAAHGYSDGWYKANGGNSKEVSWFVYINTKGELDPTGTDSKKEFLVEVRAQDVTWDDSLNNNQGGWKQPYTSSYKGFSSVPMRVNAWVVAGAPIFENAQVAPVDSNTATNSTPQLWDSIDKLHLRNRSSYKVTVKHNSGLSSIRWSPTQWIVNTTNPNGIFQANPNLDTYNLLDLLSESSQTSVYVYRNTANNGYEPLKTGAQSTVFTDMEYPKNLATTPRMALSIDRNSMKTGSVTGLITTRNYLILKWDPALASILPTSITDDSSYYEPGRYPGNPDGPAIFKDLKNTVFKPTAATGNIGSAIIIESVTEGTVDYYRWDVFVDIRADLLLADMLKDDPNYGLNDPENPKYDKNATARAGQYLNSVRYPLYLSASEVSKSTPLTSRGDALLPIDQKPPTARYTLNRKPAGTAATIGGEAADTGPVSGVVRVVLWFQRDNRFISWHERKVAGITTLEPPTPLQSDGTGATMPAYVPAGNPVWWNNINDDVIPSGVTKPNIPNKPTPPGENDPANGTGGDWAIVIDRNSPTTSQNAWGHKLPMGFADGGDGKRWYVEINSYGITSGPVYMHYVVMDKAGNARYYKERLVIMNDAAVISKIRLATDIRDDSALRTGTTGWAANAGGTGGTTGTLGAASPFLDKIRNRFTGGTDVQRGISEYISASGLGLTNNIIDFNVRNRLLAVRVETTAGSGSGKDRKFRLEYVSGATLITNANDTATNLAASMKIGRIYVIDTPGNATWGAIGADGEGPWPRGYAFMAAVNGREDDGSGKMIDKITGTGSVWELNSGYYKDDGSRDDTIVPTALKLDDVPYTGLTDAINTNAVAAEFVYASGAFGSTVGSNIVDYGGSDAYPAAGVHPLTNAASRQSMFIIKVFDGPESDTFGDFTIIRIRVNNSDMTKPFAQLYDINPKTEGQDRQNIASDEQARSLAPMFIGEGTNSNRTKGGLWNTDITTPSNVVKSGHIEPRRMEGSNYGTMYSQAQPGESEARRHSLSSAQMGGAATRDKATIEIPWANPEGFFTRDTVSGEVVLRGYAEDDQRIHQVILTIDGTDVTILNYANNGAGQAGDPAAYKSPRTGLLTAANSNVHFADSIDLYRHRVEWAYRWNTETLNSAVVKDNVTVRVTSYNSNSSASPLVSKTASDAIDDTAANIAHSNASEATKPNTSPFNPGFPVGMNKYNRISFNLRPYITGFLRNQSAFAHNTRSRQGRYMFARNETAVVTGFNLQQGTANTVINLPGMGNFTTVTVGAPGNYGITANDMRYRQFTVGANATSVMDSGVVTLTVNSIQAVNAGSERKRATPASPARPLAIQPWNIEYSPGKDGSELWDDFIQAHIWQSNNTPPNNANNSNTNGSGYFFSRDNARIYNPAMSMDPRTGILYESHNSSGGSGNADDWYNTSRTIKSPVTITTYGDDPATRANYWVTQFSDPIFFSDVYRSPGNGSGIAADTWAVSSMIGRSGTNQYWRALGGIYISGPGGGPIQFHGGGTGSSTGNPSAQNSTYSSSLYYGESTWYNASSDNNNTAPGNRLADPPSTDQFMNPHIVTSYGAVNGTNYEHIHVSYYDDLTSSIKYRYNRRGDPGAIDGGGTANVTNNNNIPKQWTNLDGGIDQEDRDATTYIIGGGAIAADARVVNPSRAAINAGKHNSIAVTSDGYPVVAYYDQTNQKLKLAVSNRVDPILANAWTIYNNISSFGTGEFVSMKIDTQTGTNRNRVHIAAMNTNKRLVYITFLLSNIAGTLTEQVVDSVGNVGRWCSLSLDSAGNPWISYMDENYLSSRDGVKLAYKNTAIFYKGVNTGTAAAPAGYCPGQYIDLNGNTLEGWETMHVPTAYRVQNPIESGREHGRLGMECIPARNYPVNSEVDKFWSGAVGYLSADLGMDKYHIAYYVK